MKKTLVAAGAVVLALGLSSCGGGSNDDDAAASKALSDSIMKSQKSGNDAASSLLTLKQKEADCIGDGLVDKIGTDQLQKYKLLTKDNKAKQGRHPGQDVRRATPSQRPTCCSAAPTCAR